MHFGIHTGQQHCSYDEMRRAWKLADVGGLEWVSVWDHLYPALVEDPGGSEMEAVALMAAVAAETSRVRVGCHVLCCAFRNPAVLAKSLITIDHISHGRLEVGLGAGWHEAEHVAFGVPFLPPRERLDRFEEALQIIKSMLTQDVTDFEGTYFTVRQAYSRPRPVQPSPRIWIGGRGERRTLRLAARYGDAWNGAYIGVEEWSRKNAVLTEWCEVEKRDPATVIRSVNLGLGIGRTEGEVAKKQADLAARFGARHETRLEEGMLAGTPQRIIDRVGRYQKAGATWVNAVLRGPIDLEGLQLFMEEVVPAFRR
jgi:alkanesulfonate monooxygenase SsuD/methylene tetrahydromethanopterin reductase-like flavin-dependent oxidoreductase (luciferase family)